MLLWREKNWLLPLKTMTPSPKPFWKDLCNSSVLIKWSCSKENKYLVFSWTSQQWLFSNSHLVCYLCIGSSAWLSEKFHFVVKACLELTLWLSWPQKYYFLQLPKCCSCGCTSTMPTTKITKSILWNRSK